MPPRRSQTTPLANSSNLNDALGYLESVRAALHQEPKTYSRFAKVMMEFKSKRMPVTEVMQKVADLFRDQRALVEGFNIFLPEGYHINYALGASMPTITAPQSKPTGSHPRAMSLPADRSLTPTLEFVQRVRTRYAQQPHKHEQFMKLFYNKSQSEQQGAQQAIENDLVHRMQQLLSDAPDLVQEFQRLSMELNPPQDSPVVVLPSAISTATSDATTFSHAASGSEAAVTVPQKRKIAGDKESCGHFEPLAKKVTRRKLQDSSSSDEPAGSSNRPTRSATPQAPKNESALTLIKQSPNSAGTDGQRFFDRVKHALDHRETYNEFLKLINLFNQDLIDTARLIRESRSFLGEGELMAQFKGFVGWDESKEDAVSIEHVWLKPKAALDRPSMNQLNIRYGSYRMLPDDEINVTCSGRDELAKSVLNDEWVSQPTYASEDTFFQAHKKNIYEEALHRTEEERHEYDFYLEGLHRTIKVLEPVDLQISQMNETQLASFTLGPNLGGKGKGIHVRVLKKIYGRETGLKVWQEIHDDPIHAIPVVLSRLRSRVDVWKQAFGEWDKIWRELDARNFYKSLDHQAIEWRATEKKNLTARAFVTQVEAARDEQMAKRASLIDPLFSRTRPRYQLEFNVEDMTVMQDALSLTMSSIDTLQGHITAVERREIEMFLRTFIPVFFVQDTESFDKPFSDRDQSAGCDVESVSSSMSAAVASTSRVGRGGRRGGANGTSGALRKTLLKNEQAKTSRRGRGRKVASAEGSRLPSPVSSDVPDIDVEASGSSAPILFNITFAKANSRRRCSFFTNTTFYVIIRLLELLYSRLRKFKDLSVKLVKQPLARRQRNALPFSLRDPDRGDDLDVVAAKFYNLLLESCRSFISGDLEQHAFEDRIRSVFGVMDAYQLFTVDRVTAAIIRQVQAATMDSKSRELFEFLKREREIAAPTTQDQINWRRNAERVLGPDENLFRIDWLPESRTITVQLFGKDDSSFDDSEVLTGRWQAYIASFVSEGSTQGIPTLPASRRPFLRRVLSMHRPEEGQPDVYAYGRLQIKVCVRTYRLFYVPHSEESLWRSRSKRDHEKFAEALRNKKAKRELWLEKFATTSQLPSVAENPTGSSTNANDSADMPLADEAVMDDIPESEENKCHETAMPMLLLRTHGPLEQIDCQSEPVLNDNQVSRSECGDIYDKPLALQLASSAASTIGASQISSKEGSSRLMLTAVIEGGSDAQSASEHARSDYFRKQDSSPTSVKEPFILIH